MSPRPCSPPRTAASSAHFGIDPLGLVRASFRNASAGSVVEGGSTITQQLAKNLFLSPKRTSPQAEEVIWRSGSKQRSARTRSSTLYLNRVYFGGGTYGIEAASRRYFGKSSRYVTLSRRRCWPGMLKAPSRYSPARSVKAASDRTDEVLEKWSQAGFLTARAGAHRQPAAARAVGQGRRYRLPLPGRFRRRAAARIRRPAEWRSDRRDHHRCRAAARVAAGAAPCPRRGGRGSQRRRRRRGGARSAGRGQGSGRRALLLDSPFDRALKRLRQPGSAFKPFVYLTALENGYTPDGSVDGPTTVDGWSPRNYTGIYSGAISLRTRWRSRSTRSRQGSPTRSGPARGRARRAASASNRGCMTTPRSRSARSEVSLLELASAYTPFANGGPGVLPHIIERVRNGDGKVLYERQSSPHRPGRRPAEVAVHERHDVRGGGRRHRQAARRSPATIVGGQDRHDAKTTATPGSSATPRITSPGCGSATTTARR